MKRVYTESQKLRNREAQRLRRAKNPERVKEVGRESEFRRRMKRYGLTPNEYNSLKQDQNNSCAICSTTLFCKRIAVDHCHTSGKVRGILCMSCNIGLGHFKDKISSLKSAIKYLKFYE